MIGSQLRLVYFGATVLYAATGVASIVFSLVCTEKMTTNMLVDLLVQPTLLKLTLSSGIICVVSCLFGLFALFNTIERQMAIRMYGTLAVGVITLEIVSGGLLWFETLQMRAFLDGRWSDTFDAISRASFQDKLHCCGFQDPRDRAVSSDFCPAQSLPTSTASGCKELIATQATSMLEFLYTVLFAFVIIDVLAFLSCVVLAELRNDLVRFRRMGRKSVMPYAHPHFSNPMKPGFV